MEPSFQRFTSTLLAAEVQEREHTATEPNGFAENGHLLDAEGLKPVKQPERHMCCGMQRAAMKEETPLTSDAYVHACIEAGASLGVRHILICGRFESREFSAVVQHLLAAQQSSPCKEASGQKSLRVPECAA